MDWHREGGRGGDCAEGNHCQGWRVTRGAVLVRGQAGNAAAGPRMRPCCRLGRADDGGLASPAVPGQLWGGGAAVPGRQLRSGEGERERGTDRPLL